MAQFHIKAEIEGIKPKIYRELLVDANMSFSKLHHVLQIAFGWSNSHLYQFHVGEELIGVSDLDFECFQADKVKLKDYLYEGAYFEYEYDFGDSWMHSIHIVMVFPDVNEKKPYCVVGKRNAPMEDSSGVFGYADLLKAIKDKKHPEHEDSVEWAGDHDPEYCNVAEVNKELKGIDQYIRDRKKYSY